MRAGELSKAKTMKISDVWISNYLKHRFSIFNFAFSTLHFVGMAENIAFSKTQNRETIYTDIAPQIQSLIEVETDLIANLANIAAVLKEAFGFFWVGFYIVKEDQLVLGPFQGPLACTRIEFDKGVCGHCYTTKKTVVVSNVDEFPGHIACASSARSEIVLPIFDKQGEVFGVLDVDSNRLNDFSEIDSVGLGYIVKLIEEKL